MNGHHSSQKGWNNSKLFRGFTIVELLVVIVVVGILAAITIVAYNGVQNSAAEASLQSDLQSAAATLAIDKKKNGAYPNSAPEANGGKGLKTSGGNSFEYSSVYDGNAYCLSATSNRNGVPGYSISSDGAQLGKGVCAGHAEPASNGSAGISWEVGSIPSASWTGVAYNQGKFAAITSGTTTAPSTVSTSTDGLSWSNQANVGTAATSGAKITGLNGHFLGMFNAGYVLSAVSTGGVTWQHASTESGYSSYRILDAAYGGGKYVGIRSTPPSTNTYIQFSTNGVDWTLTNIGLAWSSWSSIAYGNGRFVAVATSGTPNIITSEDGVTWTARAAPEANVWNSIIFAGGQFVAVASSGTNRVMTSPDGITWTPRAAAQANSWSSIAYGSGKYVAVATSGTSRVMTSTNGITWTARSTPQANAWNSVTYGNKCFVAVANSGTNRVMRSCD